MIPIKKAKQIREDLNLEAVVIYGVDEDGIEHVATHGKTTINAKQAAEIGNGLKKILEWPKNLCNSKPLDRICGNCSFFQRGYHRPGDVIQSNMYGKCMNNPEPIKRFEQDISCGNFEPKY